MNKLKTELQAVLDKNNMIGLIYATTDGKEIVRVGQLENLPVTGLVGLLFGDEEKVANLYYQTFDQILPQMWGQGDVTCFIDVISDKIVFGVYGIVKKDEAVEKYLQSKVFCKEIIGILQKHIGG